MMNIANTGNNIMLHQLLLKLFLWKRGKEYEKQKKQHASDHSGDHRPDSGGGNGSPHGVICSFIEYTKVRIFCQMLRK
jgi:hypothetical protein